MRAHPDGDALCRREERPHQTDKAALRVVLGRVGHPQPRLTRALPLAVRIVGRVRVLERKVDGQSLRACEDVPLEILHALHEVGMPAGEGAQRQRA